METATAGSKLRLACACGRQLHAKAINKIGGKWFIAPFANTKPNPHKSGTVSAINVCLGVSWFIAVIQIAAVLGDFNDQHRDFP